MLDVRDNSEWNAGRVPGAVHVPAANVAAQAPKRLPKGRPVVVACRTGSRSKSATRLLREQGIEAYDSDDDDTSRIWWKDTGVHQNATFCVQPDPISGMQCWHQRVHVTPAEPGDEYGDVVVDTAKSREAYLDWMSKTRPAGTNDSGLRRPLWYARPLKPNPSAYLLGD